MVFITLAPVFLQTVSTWELLYFIVLVKLCKELYELIQIAEEVVGRWNFTNLKITLKVTSVANFCSSIHPISMMVPLWNHASLFQADIDSHKIW